jgi:hypothetical protein
VSGSTRTINIGTASAAGSTNAINIGGGSGTTTVTFGGNIGGTFTRTGGKTNFASPAAGYASVNFAPGNDPTTLAAGDVWYDSLTNKLKLRAGFVDPIATENYITGLASNATPLVNGTAAAGSSFNFSRNDHVHPTDTSRAPLASPALTGTPLSTTAAADTNTTQIATTAFVVGQAGSATPLVNGTAAVGTSLRFARQDHVHGTDTTRAPLASPALTGTPTAPTATLGTNTTQIATTAFVQSALPAAATVAEAKLGNDTAKFISANVLQKVINSPSYYKFPRGLLSTNTAGTGASVNQGALIAQLVGPSTGAGGSIVRYSGLSGIDIQSFTGWGVGSASYGINFGKAFRLTGATFFTTMSTNTIVRVCFGKNGNSGVGDPTSAAVGWRYNQATGFIEILAHNGSSLLTLTTASNPTGWFEWEIFNDGAGNVQMFVNDVSIGTLTGGRTTWDFASAPSYVEEIQTTATPAVQPQVRIRGGGLFLQP